MAQKNSHTVQYTIISMAKLNLKKLRSSSPVYLQSRNQPTIDLTSVLMRCTIMHYRFDLMGSKIFKIISGPIKGKYLSETPTSGIEKLKIIVREDFELEPKFLIQLTNQDTSQVSLLKRTC